MKLEKEVLELALYAWTKSEDLDNVVVKAKMFDSVMGKTMKEDVKPGYRMIDVAEVDSEMIVVAVTEVAIDVVVPHVPVIDVAVTDVVVFDEVATDAVATDVVAIDVVAIDAAVIGPFHVVPIDAVVIDHFHVEEENTGIEIVEIHIPPGEYNDIHHT